MTAALLAAAAAMSGCSSAASPDEAGPTYTVENLAMCEEIGTTVLDDLGFQVEGHEPDEGSGHSGCDFTLRGRSGERAWLWVGARAHESAEEATSSYTNSLAGRADTEDPVTDDNDVKGIGDEAHRTSTGNEDSSTHNVWSRSANLVIRATLEVDGPSPLATSDIAPSLEQLTKLTLDVVSK